MLKVFFFSAVPKMWDFCLECRKPIYMCSSKMLSIQLSNHRNSFIVSTRLSLMFVNSLSVDFRFQFWLLALLFVWCCCCLMPLFWYYYNHFIIVLSNESSEAVAVPNVIVNFVAATITPNSTSTSCCCYCCCCYQTKIESNCRNIIYNSHTKTGKQTIFDMMININVRTMYVHGADAKSCKGMVERMNEWNTPVSTIAWCEFAMTISFHKCRQYLKCLTVNKHTDTKKNIHNGIIEFVIESTSEMKNRNII